MTEARVSRVAAEALIQDPTADAQVSRFAVEALILTALDGEFAGTNGDPWNVDSWTQTAGAGGGSTTIQGNKGRAAGSAGNANSGGRGVAKQGASANQKATGTFELCELGEPCRVSLWVQSSADWEDLDNPTSGFGILLPADSDTASLVVYVAGVETVLDTGTWPRTLGVKQWEFRRVNDQVRFRIWNDGDAAGAWLLSATSTALPAGGSGTFQVAYVCPIAPTVGACADFDDIDVQPDANELPTAAFTATPTGLSVAFANQSTDPDGTVTGFNWDFGDGDTSTDENPTHEYAAAGTYDVTLVVQDDQAGDDTLVSPLTVAEASGNRMGGTGAIRKPPVR